MPSQPMSDDDFDPRWDRRYVGIDWCTEHGGIDRHDTAWCDERPVGGECRLVPLYTLTKREAP